MCSIRRANGGCENHDCIGKYAVGREPLSPAFRQRLVILAVIFIAIIASLLLDFTLGPSGLPLHSLIKTLMHPSGATNGMRVIVWDIRLPYALMALTVGMALGLAGAEMQTILNNSLASPFTLGVSSAAAFGAALAIVLGIGIPGVPESGFIPANAFLLRSCPPCCSIV